MAAVLLGADPRGPEARMDRLNHHLQGHDYAKSAIDTALWDLTAQAANLPLYALLGGRCAVDMPLYHSITCVAPDDMARMAQQAQGAGMAQFQVKLGVDDDCQADVERLVKVRGAASLWRLELRGRQLDSNVCGPRRGAFGCDARTTLQNDQRLRPRAQRHRPADEAR